MTRNTTTQLRLFSLAVLLASALIAWAQQMVNGQLWPDTEGHHINAHGGNIICHEGTYYWYGEHRPYRGFTTEKGIAVDSSTDLKEWKNEGIV